MISSVSTAFCSSMMPWLGDAHAALALEVERLGDDADGQDAELLGALRDHRSGAGAGAAAHAGGDEHHVRAGEMIADLVDHLLGRGAADVRLRAGAEALGDLNAHLDDALGLRQGERLRVGVGDDEIAAEQAGRDHVVDGVAAGAADTEYGDPRLELPDIGHLEIDGHGCLFQSADARVSPHVLAGRFPAVTMVKWVIRSSPEATVRPA